MKEQQLEQLTPQVPYAILVEAGLASRPARVQFATAKRLKIGACTDQRWIWEGLIAKENITLLTSMWKSGKTTLLSVLLAKLCSGGTLGGLPVRPGRAAVVSEESRQLWGQRDDHLQFGDSVEFTCRPYRGLPTSEQWQALMDQLVEWHEEKPLDLVVIDPLASFLPSKSENEASCVMKALLPLQQLLDRGMGVLLLHHPRKAIAAEGQSARGSGAICGCVDIIVEMGWIGRPSDDDRRRKLLAFSRYRETPRRLSIELNPEGTDYRTLGAGDDFDDGWQVLFGVLEDARRKLNRREILENWPEDFTKPHDITLLRWLNRAVHNGLVLQEGTGRKNSPFLYWLKSNDEKFESGLRDLSELAELKTMPGMIQRGLGVAKRMLTSRTNGEKA